MECIRGKQTYWVSHDDLADMAGAIKEATRPRVHVDLGTGDGRFPLITARREPAVLHIGVDACRENLARASSWDAPNLLFVIANAERLPDELTGTAERITINFPWGSLLDGLLTMGSEVWRGIEAVCGDTGRLSMTVNADALDQSGCEWERAVSKLSLALTAAGFRPARARSLTVRELRRLDSSWAKRLAFGRDPRTVELAAGWRASPSFESRRPWRNPEPRMARLNYQSSGREQA